MGCATVVSGGVGQGGLRDAIEFDDRDVVWHGDAARLQPVEPPRSATRSDMHKQGRGGGFGAREHARGPASKVVSASLLSFPRPVWLSPLNIEFRQSFGVALEAITGVVE